MARRDRLTRVAVGIGTAMGEADRKARQVAKARLVAKEELEEIAKQVEVLKATVAEDYKAFESSARIARVGNVSMSSGLLLFRSF